MKVINSIHHFRVWREKIIGTVGFVPTMGALHDGHISLIKKSNNLCQNTAVSIYVNPMQFSPNEDFGTYPKNIELDLEVLSTLDVEAVLLPTDLIMYPQDFSTFVEEIKLSKVLEGESRHTFFRGVTTVVVKLFNIVQPSHVFFGEKDAQQLLIIKKIIKDLAYDIKLIGCPIIRERNGLAKSSRNQYLTEINQKHATRIFKSLEHGKRMLDSGERNASIIRKKIIEFLKKEKYINIDYVSIAYIDTLDEVSMEIIDNILVSVAVYIEGIRLIDNFKYCINVID